MWGVAAEIPASDFKGFRAGDGEALGRILVEIEPWLLKYARWLRSRTASGPFLEDLEDQVQETLAALWSWFGRSAAGDRPATIPPEFLGLARQTLRHVSLRAPRLGPQSAMLEVSHPILAEVVAPDSIDAWRWFLENLENVAKSATNSPLFVSRLLRRHASDLLTLAQSVGRYPSVNELVSSLHLHERTAYRIRAELREFLALIARA